MNAMAEQIVGLISERLANNPSPTLYALRTAWLEFGDLVGYYYGDETRGVVSPIGQDLWHIVSYFSDNGLFVVIKSWSKYKQRWCYEVHSAFGLVDGLEMLEEKRAKKSV